MTFLTWILAGVVCGALGGFIMNRGTERKLKVDMVVGVAGAIAGGLILAPVFEIEIVNQPSTSFPTLLIGLAGAILLLAAFYLYRTFKARTA